MKSILFGTLLATCLLTLSPQNSVAQTALYGGIGRGGGANSGWLIRVDQKTGLGTLVGHPDSVPGLTGLAFDISGTLYGTTISGQLGPPRALARSSASTRTQGRKSARLSTSRQRARLSLSPISPSSRALNGYTVISLMKRPSTTLSMSLILRLELPLSSGPPE